MSDVLPCSSILSRILQVFISKLVEDTEHYHGGQGLTRLCKQGIGPKHHGRERGAVKRRKRWAFIKGQDLVYLNQCSSFIHYLRLYISRSISMMSARGNPKRLKDAWIKTLHMIRDVQSEFHNVSKEPEKRWKLLEHAHGNGEKKGQNVVVLRTED